MTIADKDYALLDKDSYNTRPLHRHVTLGDVTYEIIDTYSNPVTGYHAAAYQRTDTHEIVIAHRGTEKSLGVIQDGSTDLGMVVTGFNAQLPDARAFTKRVQEYADQEERNKHWPVQVTTTGHSLGGTLAQITAYENHLHGVTFNAYGAVDLQHHIPQGGQQVTNYVRATDVVSAASRHYGTVRVVATAQDIHDLANAGYDDYVTATSLRNPLGAISLAAHSIDNFAPDHPSLTPSDLSFENEARACLHAPAIGLYRADVQALRSNTLSHAWEMAHKVGAAQELLTSAGRSALHGEFGEAGHTLEQAGHRAVENLANQRETVLNTVQLTAHAIEHLGQQAAHATGEAYDATRDAVAQGAQTLKQQTHLVTDVMSDGLSHMTDTLRHPGSWFESRSATPVLLSHPTHPDHAMYLQAREGVYRLDAKHQRSPDQRSDQLAAALVVAARREGMQKIDAVALGETAEYVFAAERGRHGSFDRHAHVDTVAALDTPMAQSSMQLQVVMEKQAAEQLRAQAQPMAQQHEPQVSRHVGRSM